MSSPAGLLQQSYAADANAPAGQISALIGQVNPQIVLQSLADKDEASTGVVLGVWLKLKSAAG
jgi:hypothetical protein